jgi:heme-degrading monooxygenase HmoA
MKPFVLASLIVVSASSLACSDDAENPATGGGGSGAGSGGSTASGGAGPDVQALYDCDETDFAPFVPLAGPGFDADQGGLLPPTQDSYVVHSTHLIVKEGGMAQVNALTGQIIGQLMETPGFVAYALAGSDACSNVRTLGIWESEEAMYGMVGSGAHAEAMAQTTEVSITGKVTHWTANADEVNALDWPEAKARIADATPSPIYE